MLVYLTLVLLDELEQTYLVDNNEEHSVDQDRPDEDVGKDASNKAMLGRDHDGTVPVQSNEGPGKGTRDSWHVDALGVRIMAEVQRREVEEVDDQQDLGPDEVRANEEHDPAKVKQVVEDEVATDRGGRVDRGGIAGEEVTDVA